MLPHVLTEVCINLMKIKNPNNLCSIGKFKHELIKDYNAINNRVFGIGAVRQKIDIFDEKLIIIAENKRVKSLSYLKSMDSHVGELANHFLIEGLKRELCAVLTEKYNFEVTAIFKDYDIDAELSCTFILMKKNIKEYFNL